MLTEAEKKWLEERTWPVWDYFSCRTCKGMHESTMRCIFGRCPLMTGYYKDAAEFEARVAHHATNGYPLISCPMCKYRAHGCYKLRHKLSGHWCFLKHARLTVEEEMDK